MSQHPDITFRVAGEEAFDEVLVLMAEFYAYGDISFDPAAAKAALRELLDNRSLGIVWLIERA